MNPLIMDFFALLLVIGLIGIFFVIFILLVVHHNYRMWESQAQCYRHRCRRNNREEVIAEEVD